MMSNKFAIVNHTIKVLTNQKKVWLILTILKGNRKGINSVNKKYINSHQINNENRKSSIKQTGS